MWLLKGSVFLSATGFEQRSRMLLAECIVEHLHNYYGDGSESLFRMFLSLTFVAFLQSPFSERSLCSYAV